MRILVVEDERALANALAEGLREAGHTVDLAHDGDEGESQASLIEYDAIVLDVMLPRLDGWEVCRRLRRHRVETPIMMLTARDSLDDKVRGLDCGADDYLTKPFAFPELLARLRSLFRRSSRTRDPVLRVGDVEIDSSAQMVRRGGVVVDLTPREYAILEYMAYNAGRVLTRDQILSHVWPADYDGMSNVVDVFIRYLRRKLGEGRNGGLIRTVVGVGYMFKSDEPA